MTGLGDTPEPEADHEGSDADPSAHLNPDLDELAAANALVAAAFPGSTHSNRRQKYKRGTSTPTVTPSQSKRARLLDLIEGGSSISDALADTGISQKSHEYYRRTDPQYRARVDIARRQHAKSRGDGWTGDSASFNETFFPEEYPTPPFHYDILRILKSAAPGTITLINCYPNSGKGLALDTPLPTPTGWTTMGELASGDVLFDEAGDPCTVQYVSPVWNKPCFEVAFANGEVITCDEDHLWLTEARSTRRPAYTGKRKGIDYPEIAGQNNATVKTIVDIAASVERCGRPNHRVRVHDGLQPPEADLPIDPYVLGAWLGDGDSKAGTMTCFDPQILDEMWLAGYRVRPNKAAGRYGILGLQRDLRLAGLLHNKHIPAEYLRASFKQRLALLQGLMDTDGSCAKSGVAEFCTIKPHLAEQFVELATSLGMKPRSHEGRAMLNGRDCGPVWKIQLSGDASLPLFRLQRKIDRLVVKQNDRNRYHTITSVTPVASVPTRCIQVDSPSHLFLAGRSMIPTHNTRILENHICETLATDPQHRFVIASKAQLHARKMLDTVKDRMTNITSYPGYIGRFGPFYVDGMDRAGKPWTRDFIKIARNDSNQRDHNVQVMGWSGQILGARVDTIILDDIQTGDNMSQVEEMLGKFRREFYTRLKGGRIIIIGNRIANGDFYERLLDLDIIEPENHFDFPAVDHQGNSLWPDRWPTDELDKTRRVVGESVWWTTYQQKPQLASNATFDEDMVERAKDHDRRVGTFTPGEPCVLSIDPGLDPGATAIVALGFGADQMRVIDAEKHYDFSQQEQILDLIEQYAIRYQPQHVVIETVAFQRALARDERLDAMSRRLGFQVRGHITNRNKLDPVMGVAAMASSFIRDEMRIPWAEDATQSRMEPLVTELRAWRPNVPTKLITQDLVMALWFAWVAVLDLRHGMGMGADGWRRSNHLPWQRSSAPRLHAVRRSA